MNIKFLILAIIVVTLGSCSSAYRTGQTPDDVYYSPAKPVENYVAVDQNNNQYTPEERYSNNNNGYLDDPCYYDNYRNDRWLRMSVGSPYRLSLYNRYYWNDWNYGYSPSSFYYGSDFYFNDWYTPYYWNGYYNPYSYNYVIINKPGASYKPIPSRPTFNRNTYLNTNTNNTNRTIRTTTPARYYNTNTNTRTNSESRTYTPPVNNSSNRPTRVYTPSTNRNDNPREIKRPTRRN